MANNIILSGGQVEMNVDFSTAKDQWFTGVVSGAGSIEGHRDRCLRPGGYPVREQYLHRRRDIGYDIHARVDPARTMPTASAPEPSPSTTPAVTQAQGLGATTNLTSGSGVANNIVINSGATLNLGGPSATGNVLLSGVISGAGNLNKSDVAATTFILSGTNTYNGSTTVSTGILQLGNGGTTGSLTGTSGITNNANLTINRGNAFTQATDLNNKAINGNGSVTQAGAGTTTLSLANGYSGATTISTGALQLGDGGATGSLTGTSGITNNANLTINRSTAFTQATDLNNKAITGNGSFTQAGSGTTTLSLTNTYSGATTVSNGTLIVNGSISTSLLTTVQTGATLKGQGAVGALTVNGSGTFAPGTSIESITTGSLTLLADAIFEQEIDDAFAGGNTSGDLTAVTGTLNLALTNDSVLTLQEVGTSGRWNVGDKITLIGYSTGTWNGGLFTYLGNTLNDDTNFTFSGIDWTFNYNDTAFGDNYQSDMSAFTGSARYVTMTAVPEPRAALLGGLGLLMLLRRRRS